MSIRQYHTIRKNLLRIEEIGSEDAVDIVRQTRYALEMEDETDLDLQELSGDLIHAAGESRSEEVRKRAASVNEVIDEAVS